MRVGRPAIRLMVLYSMVILATQTAAQQFGGNPGTVKWKQINTDTVRVIFPEGLEQVAGRVTDITHHLQRDYSGSIGNKKGKVSIVLQKDVTISNAYVQLAPSRSEFYMTPPQNAFELGAQSWADLLSIHEYRHVQQNNNFNVGLSRTASYLFGQYGRVLANNAAIPNWFYEGDAVYNETLLSQQGRGRLPYFFNGFKSLYYDSTKLNFSQLRNGSLKRYVPGHYELGYLLVAYGREKYGETFWKDVTHDAASFKSLFYPMQAAVKRHAGVSYHAFTSAALDYYNHQWAGQVPTDTLHWLTTTQHHNVVNYLYPYVHGNDTLIVLKNSYRDIPAFYKISPDGKEFRVAVRDITVDDYFSYNNGRIVYGAFAPDSRWGNRNYSIIRLMDVQTGSVRTVTAESKYFSPDISHSGDQIAAIAYTPEQQSLLCLMDEHGNLIRSVQNKPGHYFSYPKFSTGDSLLFVLDRTPSGQMAILQQPIQGGAMEPLLPYANRIIGFPVVQGDSLLYSSSGNGTDEIWVCIISRKQHFRLASGRTGLYQASFTGSGQLVSSVFTSKGFRLAASTPRWQPVTAGDTLHGLYVDSPFNRHDNAFLTSIQQGQYPITNYPRLFRPFNFHSWAPGFTQTDYSFTVYGENVLNTLQSELYYVYNTNERYHRAGYTAIYGGLYVQPYVDVNNTWNRNAQISEDTTVFWNELNLAFGLRLPVNLTGGRQYRNLTFSASYNVNDIQWKSAGKPLLTDLNYITARVTYAGQVQQAPQQIYPHWAQTLTLQYRTSASSVNARQLLATGSLFLPGIAKTHSLVLNAAYQARDTAGEYLYTNNFPISRGYEDFNFPRMVKIGINYHFPCWYPDWGFAGILFFNRLRANVFYDYTNLKSLRTGDNYQLRSTGGELYFDTRWWNQQPITVGIRYSRLLDYELAGAQPNRWEIILPVTLF